ncbi:hypothetical protein B5G43_09880 [Flavonifractor sp. An92]|uniref:S-layer homology domain-containing protein n=1 Tax=Flavonifractor sp. An92 TaxID=1965666 RepID=UPI000B3A5833|nr:S-layer homology domain-containing protein [Flavonifractor sp. An92]OUN06256.1 hypothetical protein B5G43_09880 [Flavonifractor sp. An92]
MRNLKRALSMALAAVMVLGLMVVGASAASYEDFTDKDEIKNSEAVATMVSLGVISGKDDGSYDPAGSLTRAEACTLIARMLGGGKDPVLGSNIKSNFKDTQGHWAETYIAYCANLGIIAGVGNGNFKPDDTLTGSAAAKMVLCALGYKPEFEGIGGANWELATNTLATKIDLYNGLETLNPSATISRDDVAQLIYNGVQAQEVEYRNLQGDYSGTLYAYDQGSMLENRFGVVKVTGIVMANDEVALAGSAVQKDGKSAINVVKEVKYGNGSYTGVESFNVDIDTSLIGQEVVIYVKPASQLNPNPASDAVLGTPIATANNTVVTTYAKLDGTTDPTWSKFLKDNDLTDGGKGYVNYAEGTVNSNARGVELTFIDNTGDGKVDIKLAVNKTLAKVSTYNSTKEYVKFSGDATEYSFDDVMGLEDIALNDYVLYYVANGNAHVEKLTAVTASLESYKVGKSATLGGVTYKISGLTNNAGDLTTFDGTFDNDSDLKFENTYDLYLDNDNNLIAFKLTEESENKDYAVVLDAGLDYQTITSDPTGQVKLLLADGTKVTGAIDMEATQANYKKADSANADTVANFANNFVKTGGTKRSEFVGTVVTYTKSDDGYVLNYTNAPANTTTTTNVVKNMASMTVGGSNVVVNSSTVFFFKNNDDTSVITGTGNLSSTAIVAAKVKDVAYTGTSTKVAKAVYIEADPGTSTSSYAYVVKGATVKPVDGVNYEYYTAVLNDGTVTSFQTATGTNITVSGVYKYETNSKGVTTLTPTTADVDGALVKDESVVGYISTLSGNVIGVTYNGKESFYTVGDAKVYNVEDTDNVFTTELAKNQSVVISTKTSDSKVVLDTIFVTANDVSEYGVYLNGTKVGDYKVGQTVVVNVPNVAAAGDITVTGATRTDTSSTNTATFVMPAGAVNVTSTYALTYENTNAKVYSDSACKNEVATGTKIVGNTTLYVKSESNAASQSELDATNVTLKEVTAAEDGTSAAVYSFTMPQAATNPTFTQK